MNWPISAWLLCTVLASNAPAHRSMKVEQRSPTLEPEAPYVRRIDPPRLPSAIRRYLARHHYQIATRTDNPQLRSVVVGAFAGRGSRDWAVLCTGDARSFILVFWGGSLHAPSRIGTAPKDADRGLAVVRR